MYPKEYPYSTVPAAIHYAYVCTFTVFTQVFSTPALDSISKTADIPVPTNPFYSHICYAQSLDDPNQFYVLYEDSSVYIVDRVTNNDTFVAKMNCVRETLVSNYCGVVRENGQDRSERDRMISNESLL